MTDRAMWRACLKREVFVGILDVLAITGQRLLYR